ncbi:FecR family protein [Pedobacter sp. GR22-6]|uniref:FecR family protein n=1 Tax=Pedobacter sp. GR22-6 TaxID=3127957 RepID=UPI00307D6DD9
MSYSTEYIELLVFKFNNGSINPEEMQALLEWYNSHDDQQVIIPLDLDESADDVKSRILSGLLSKVAAETIQSEKPIFSIRWMAAAAAVLLIALGTWMVLEHKVPVRNSDLVHTSIQPGGNKATLTLEDGRTISLSTSQAGIIAGEKITYTNGTPVEDINLNEPGDANRLLVLHTPRGGTYSITLSDGTQVWLNAESTIKYPLHFASEERIVELEGEAYFHVKSTYRANGEKIPFKVLSKHQEVEVVGTQFNITAYPEQETSKTTLVEGKVLVSDQRNRIVLMPNQQASTTFGKTSVKQVNPANYIAWRDGKFSFDGKTFEETMNEIGRWYDLDIVYESRIPEEELIGDAYRNQKISLVLRILDVAEIDYKLDVARRKLIIKGKNNINH